MYTFYLFTFYLFKYTIVKHCKYEALKMNLVINNTEITTDKDGRYSLNDLHKASGGSIKDLPNKFMAGKSFNEMVSILNADNPAFSPIIKKKGRYGGGTWVCKELVYKYAMWVNVDFELKVIRRFDSIVNSINPPSTMKALNDLTLKIESDKEIASECGKALNNYKKVKKENQEIWIKSIEDAQLSLFSK